MVRLHSTAPAIESVAESLDLASGFDEQKVAAELTSLDALRDSHADASGS
jgi:hypothetical protein